MEIENAVRDLLLMWDAIRQVKDREAAIAALVAIEPDPGLLGRAAEYASAECDKAANGFRPELQRQFSEWADDLTSAHAQIHTNRVMRASASLRETEVIEAPRSGLRVRLFEESGPGTYAFWLEQQVPGLQWVRVPIESIRYDERYAAGIIDWPEALLRASTALASAIDRFGRDEE